jgi:hypothetical protein
MATNPKRQVSIFVNGKEVEASAKAIRAAYKEVSNQMAKLVIGSDEYLDKLAEVRKLDGVLKQHRDAVRGVEQGWNIAKGGMSSFIGVAAGAFTVDAILGYGKQLLGTATNLELLEKKARVVFAETLPQVTAAAEENARAMGLTNSEYIAAAANIQDLLVPMGFQRKEAADISTSLVDLSGALAEWSGGTKTASEVSDILAKSLLGERDALNSLGIDIKQAEVDAELLARGMANLTGEAKKQAEATVTLDLILRKSTDAQAAFADGADSMARRQAEMSARITETTEKLSTILLPVFERLVSIAGGAADAVGWVVDSISELVSPVESGTKALGAQINKVADLEANMLPLLDRYDELQGKATLNATEQAELSKIISTLAGTIPSAVTEFDKYGNAIGINTDKAREFIETERARLKFVNAELIASLKSEQKELEVLIQREEALRKSGIGDIERRAKAITEWGARLKGLEAELARLEGSNLEVPGASAPSATTPPPPTGPTEAEKKAADAAAKERQKKREQEAKELSDHLARVQEIVRKNAEAAALEALSADERELERVRLKYDKEIEQVQAKFSNTQAVKDAVAALELQKEEELQKLQEEQRFKRIEAEVDAEEEEQERLRLLREKYEADKLAKQGEVAEFVAENTMTELELELKALDDHYADLIKEAEAYGIDTTAITEKYVQKRNDIIKKGNQKAKDDEANSLQERLAATQAAYGAFSSLLSSSLELQSTLGAESADFQKVATLAKIAFDTAAAISSLTAASQANPANAVTFGAAGIAQYVAGITQIISNIAQAKKILFSAPPVKQKAEGGFLSVTGQSDGRQYRALPITAPNTGMLPGFPVLFQSAATGSPVLASERGAEYFVAAHHLRNPQVANLVRMVDNITHGGRAGIPQFADGGTNPPGGGTTATTPPQSFDAGSVRELVSAVNTLNALLARGIIAVVPDRTITDISERFKEINTGSGGFFS